MKKQTSSYPRFEKTFSLFGCIVVLLALVASVFSVIHNGRFIHEPLDMLYYAQHFVIVGIGFLIGYLLSGYGRPIPSSNTKITSGLQFALLSYILFISLDLIRMFANDALMTIGYPWGKIVFMGTPVLVLMLALVIYLLTFKWRAHAHRMASPSFIIVVVLFFATHAFQLFDTLVGIASIKAIDAAAWLSLLGLAVHPLIITSAAFVALHRIPPLLERLSYAVAVGVLFVIAQSAIWEFRTNPELSATIQFGVIASAVMVTTLILFLTVAHKQLARDTSKKKKSR